MKLENVNVGDKLRLELLRFGTLVSTAQVITNEYVLYLADRSVSVGMMNEKWDNSGGYDESDLKKWIRHFLFPMFPVDIRSKMYDLTIPTYGQIFGNDQWYYDCVNPDIFAQLPLMIDKRNVVAGLDGDDIYYNYWLQNSTKDSVSMASFVHVTPVGTSAFNNATASYGIRPMFKISKHNSDIWKGKVNVNIYAKNTQQFNQT